MTLNNESMLTSKIKRFADKSHIHNLFIFDKSGLCLFHLNFSKVFKIKEDQLISSFITAIMSFTIKVIGNRMEAVEMGNVKIVIIEKGSFYYGLLCDSLENLQLLEDLVIKIHYYFINYINRNNVNIQIQHICDEEFKNSIREILISSISNEFDIPKENKILTYLEELSLNEDLKGIILLTDNGRIIYSSLKKASIKNFLKEVDFRIKICNNNILKLFYTSKDNNIIFSEYVEDSYFIILVFDFRIKFGLAEHYLSKVVKFIKSVIH